MWPPGPRGPKPRRWSRPTATAWCRPRGPAPLGRGRAQRLRRPSEEGEDLRAALGPHRPARIFVLDGASPGSAARLAQARLIPVLNSPAQIEVFAAYARPRGPLPCAIQVDTGMHRLGLQPEELQALTAATDRLTGLKVELVLSHLACADQARAPHERPAGRPLPQGSGPAAGRPGAAWPTPPGCSWGRTSITTWSARASPSTAAARSAGRTPGSRPWRPSPPRSCRCARWPRARRWATALTSRPTAPIASPSSPPATPTACRAPRPAGPGLVRRRFPEATPLGRISMDLLAIDVTGCEDASPGAMVELLGPHVTLDDAAAAAGTVSYELLTWAIGPSGSISASCRCRAWSEFRCARSRACRIRRKRGSG